MPRHYQGRLDGAGEMLSQGVRLCIIFDHELILLTRFDSI